MHDRQEVLGELGLWSGAFGTIRLEHHEFHAAPVDDEPLEELVAETAEAVAVGNGNRAYTSVKAESQ